MTTQLSTIDFLKKEEVKQKFQEILGKNATTFMTTVMSLVAQNKMLQDAATVLPHSHLLRGSSAMMQIEYFPLMPVIGKREDAQTSMPRNGYFLVIVSCLVPVFVFPSALVAPGGSIPFIFCLVS